MANSSALETSAAFDDLEMSEERKAYWTEAMKIPFWKAAGERTENAEALGYASVEEFFTRRKIRPAWFKLKKQCVGQISAFIYCQNIDCSWIEMDKKLNAFLSTVLKEVNRAEKSQKEVLQALQEHVSKLPASMLHLFPPDFDLELHSMYRGLATPNELRKGMSEMSYDIVVFSSILHRYFLYSFPFTSHQSIADYLRCEVAERQEPDFALYKDEDGKRTIFLVCEHGEQEEHATNHEDLLKLLDTLQSVIMKRVLRYPSCSKVAYGVLCGGNKMTMFRMEYNKEGDYFTCYFLGQHQSDMYTASLDLTNIDKLLRCCILITLEGKMLQLGKAKKSPETSSSGSKPPLVDAKAASVGECGKKKKVKQRHNTSSSSEIKEPPSSPSNSSERDLRRNLERMNLTNNNNTNAFPATNTQTKDNDKDKRKQEREKKKQEQNEVLEAITKNKLCNKYVVLERLTRKVYRVGFSDRKYVAKFYFTSDAKSEEELILEQLSDKFLKPVDSFKVSDEIRCVIFPYIENHTWLLRHQFANSARSVLLALAELHSKNIAHCDVKYSNVVFGEEETYLIDFDLALCNPDEWELPFRGTFGYRAPETIRTGDISCKSDIYSFGIFLFELARKSGIYDMPEELADDDELVMARNIRIAIKRLALRSPWHAEVVSTIEKCMNEDPTLRPSAEELLSEPFLSQAADHWPSQAVTHNE